MKRIFIFLVVIFFCFSKNTQSQGFSTTRNPGIIFYQVGLGAGTFFSAPRPTVELENIVNQKVPVLTLGLGKRYGNHVSVKSNLSFQQFSAKEFIGNVDGEDVLDPMFDGYSLALDITPSLNVMPSYNLKKRFPVDLNLGLGLGYLLTNRTEKLYFNGKYYEINLTERSPYIPVRASLSFKVGFLNDVSIEGAFFNTWLDNKRPITKLTRKSDHFAQLNVMFRRYVF
ncbi:hypothetical protein [Daejeonella sp.]|uniref:hypothetical protein n=1 Tax=Daejeonella sp. TaxID=2805397 RepID=UPI0025B89C8A|nr:hypothetical protein [Daejeonella sp.]